MKKDARARRQDPLQEGLVTRKDNLNQRIKQLIALWLDTKRAYNGRPAALLGLPERSDIKYPLPPQVQNAAQALHQMTDEALTELAAVIQEQENYSVNRQKGRAELQQNVKAASSIVSRTLTRAVAPFRFSDKERWIRLHSLRASASFKRLLEDIQENILSHKKRNSIPNAVYKTKDLFYIFINDIYKPLDGLVAKTLEEEKVEKTNTTIEPQEVQQESQVPEEPPAQDDKISYDLKKTELQDRLDELQRFIYDNSNNPLWENYGNLKDPLTAINKIRFYLNIDKLNVVEEKLKRLEVIRNEIEKVNNESPQIPVTKEAGYASRWLKRKVMELRPTRDSWLRASVDQEASATISSLDDLMRVLETFNVDSYTIAEALKGFCVSLGTFLNGLAKLADMHNDSAKIERYELRDAGKTMRVEVINTVDINSLKKFAALVLELSRKFEKISVK